MTAITFFPVKSAGSHWRHFTAALRAFFAASQQQRVARELARFSDRELADLGLTRGDIPPLPAASGAVREVSCRRRPNAAGLRFAPSMRGGPAL